MFHGKFRTITALQCYCCFSWKLFIYKRGEWMVNGCKHETKPTRSEGKVNGNIWRRTQRYKQTRLDPKNSAKFYIVKLSNILNINKPPPPVMFTRCIQGRREPTLIWGGGGGGVHWIAWICYFYKLPEFSFLNFLFIKLP